MDTVSILGCDPALFFLAVIESTDELPAIIVIQEWWGINDQVKVHAEEIAAQGYDIAIPDL